MTKVIAGLASKITTGGQSVIAAPNGAAGGYIVNPQLAVDQGVSPAEVLFVDPTGPAASRITATTIALQPGQYYYIPPNSTIPVWVNAVSSGHSFVVVVVDNTSTLTPITGPFPPAGPAFTKIIPSYLYQQYTDDDTCQDFVNSFNTIAQNYLDTFNDLNLPVYTGPIIAGQLLDWVAAGVYGLTRPALSSGHATIIGPLNTYEFNTQQLNKFKIILPDDIVVTNDDIFKRILTWHIYKGDGKVFDIKWLKRRIYRFLYGTNGTAPNIDETYQVSITFGPNHEVSIRLLESVATLTKAFLLNSVELNTIPLNYRHTTITPLPAIPNAAIFKEAVDSGALELPFQFTYTVTIVT